jgi:hypothetical protein
MLSPPVPLWEVAGADDIIRVHVPFFMTDLSQIKKRLGSFSNDSAFYIKEFKYLTQLFSTLILFPNPSDIQKKNQLKQAEGGPQAPPRRSCETGI